MVCGIYLNIADQADDPDLVSHVELVVLNVSYLLGSNEVSNLA